MGLVELAAVNDLPLHESPRLRVIGLIPSSAGIELNASPVKFSQTIAGA